MEPERMEDKGEKVKGEGEETDLEPPHEKLPVEIMTSIARILARNDQIKTLAALSSTCIAYYDAFLELLYRDFRFTKQSAKFFYQLYDEILLLGLLRLEYYLLTAFGSRGKPAELQHRTLATRRAKFFHTIILEKDTKDCVRPREEGRINFDFVFRPSSEALPILFPNLRVLSLSADLVSDSRCLGNDFDEDIHGFPVAQDQTAIENDKRSLRDVLCALDIMMRPPNLCIHFPRGPGLIGTIDTRVLTNEFVGNEAMHPITWPVIMYHNYPLDRTPHLLDNYQDVSVHIRPHLTSEIFSRRREGVIAILGRGYPFRRLQTPCILHDILPADEEPTSEARKWSKIDVTRNTGSKSLREPQWNHTWTKLPDGVDLDCVESLALPSSFAKAFWEDIRDPQSLSSPHWCRRYDDPNHKHYQEIYSALQNQLFCLPPDPKSIEGICLLCGRE